MEGALHDARQIFDALHTVDALAKWTIDLALIGIMVQVYLLVRVPAVIVGRNVTSDDHHRYRIESSRRDACGRICKPWAKMAQHNTGLARSSCIAIRCMRCDLFVAGGDKPNATLAQRIQQCNNRVAAQTKDHLNAKALQVFNQQIRRNPLFRLVFGLQTDLRVCRHDNAAPFFHPSTITELAKELRIGVQVTQNSATALNGVPVALQLEVLQQRRYIDDASRRTPMTLDCLLLLP